MWLLVAALVGASVATRLPTGESRTLGLGEQIVHLG
jgi:hypothetical protein